MDRVGEVHAVCLLLLFSVLVCFNLHESICVVLCCEAKLTVIQDTDPHVSDVAACGRQMGGRGDEDPMGGKVKVLHVMLSAHERSHGSLR